MVKNLNDEKVDADCNSPPDFKGRALTDLEQNALPCEYEDQFNPNRMDFGLPSAKSKRYHSLIRGVLYTKLPHRS